MSFENCKGNWREKILKLKLFQSARQIQLLTSSCKSSQIKGDKMSVNPIYYGIVKLYDRVEIFYR